MPKKTRRPLPVQGSTAAPGPGTIIAITAVIAALAGAGIAWSVSATRTNAAAKSAPIATQPTPPASPAVAALTQAADSDATPIPSPAMLLDVPPTKVAVNMGNWSYDHKNFPGAIAYYQEAIRRGFDNPDIRTDLGNAYRFTGDLHTALTQYGIAQKQSPKHENSLFNQAACYLSLGDTKKAIATWQDYIQRFPNGEHKSSALELIAQAQSGTR